MQGKRPSQDIELYQMNTPMKQIVPSTFHDRIKVGEHECTHVVLTAIQSPDPEDPTMATFWPGLM